MKTITWKIHLSSPRENVFWFLSTDEGRAKFWAESAELNDGYIHWIFPNGLKFRFKFIEAQNPSLYSVEYFGGSTVRFELSDDGSGGTDLALKDAGVREEDYEETHAGWISVLMSLKAAVDHGIDLRNHDSGRTWDGGYVDN